MALVVATEQEVTSSVAEELSGPQGVNTEKHNGESVYQRCV